MAQQPPGSYPPPPTDYAVPAAAPRRPGSVTTAGIFLIILGALAGLGGIFMTLGAAFLATADFGEQFGEQFGQQFGDLFQAAAGVAVVLGILVIVYAVFKIISGAKVLALRNGWRVAGIVLCAIAIVGWILSLISSFTGGQQQGFDPTTFEVTTVSSGPNIGGIILSLLFLGANVVTLVLLARAGDAFRRTAP